MYFGSAWIGLRLIRLMLRVLGYRQSVRVLARLSPNPEQTGYTSSMRAAAWGIERVDAWWPHQPRGCLRRSLLFWWLFRWLGYSSEIRTGLRRSEDGLELHAWVESRGLVLNDRLAKVRQFTVLWDDISTRVIASRG
jgi:hypothetical protein